MRTILLSAVSLLSLVTSAQAITYNLDFIPGIHDGTTITINNNIATFNINNLGIFEVPTKLYYYSYVDVQPTSNGFTWPNTNINNYIGPISCDGIGCYDGGENGYIETFFSDVDHQQSITVVDYNEGNYLGEFSYSDAIYNIVAVPEINTWAMMLLGFVLIFGGYYDNTKRGINGGKDV